LFYCLQRGVAARRKQVIGAEAAMEYDVRNFFLVFVPAQAGPYLMDGEVFLGFQPRRSTVTVIGRRPKSSAS
jgi:hypothetical protein